MNIASGGVVLFIDKEMVKVDELGKWTAFQISNKGKKIVIVTLCRILQETEQGVHKAVTQCNKMKGKQNTATVYRKQIFKEVIDYCRSIKDLNDIIVAEDLNQDIVAKEVQQFF